MTARSESGAAVSTVVLRLLLLLLAMMQLGMRGHREERCESTLERRVWHAWPYKQYT